MRLLLTRAIEDAARTRAGLVLAGHSVLTSPIIAVLRINAAWPTGVVDALVATSGHAFSALGHEPSPEARRLMPLLLVGQRTAAVARENGFVGPSLVAANATELAVAITHLRHRPTRLVYIAGLNRKADLEATLTIIGQTMDVIEVYEAKEATALSQAAIEAIWTGGLDGVLHFSRRSADLFIALARSHDVAVSALNHFCLSEDVAAPLRDAGCSAVAVAEAPSEAALLALVGRNPDA